VLAWDPFVSLILIETIKVPSQFKLNQKWVLLQWQDMIGTWINIATYA